MSGRRVARDTLGKNEMLLRASFWLPMIVSIVWLGAAAVTIANGWSGERVSSREYLFRTSQPDQDRECRDRFAFWPDGRVITSSEFSESFVNHFMNEGFSGKREEKRTPDEIARDKWAININDQIVECALPQLRADAIRKERTRLVTLVVLPPILLLVGMGLIFRTTGNIPSIAGKLLVNVGVLIAALTFAGGIGQISDIFVSLATGYLNPGPNFRHFYFEREFRPEFGAFLALLIPISAALWWPRPNSSSRITAGCLGVAAAVSPVVAQILIRPFTPIYSDSGMNVATWMIVFAVILLSIGVIRSVLKGGFADAPRSIVPPHIRKGLLRLYLVIAIPWGITFGYLVYEAENVVTYYYEQHDDFVSQLFVLEKPSSSPTAKEAAANTLARYRHTWQVRSNDDFFETIDRHIETQRDRIELLIYALLAGFAPPLIYPFVLWALAGFRKPTSQQKASLDA